MKRSYFILIIAVAILFSVSLSGCALFYDKEGNTWENTKIPWKDYEETKYKIINNGVSTGEMVYTIEKTSLNGTPAYQISDRLLLKEGEYYTGAVISPENLKPFTSFLINHPPKAQKQNEMEINGTYGEKFDINIKYSKGTEKVSKKLPPVYYDNETLLELPRAFPLKADYARRIRVCVLLTNKVEPFRLEVIGQEKVTVSAGVINCYKVKIGYIGLNKYANIYAWYSVDSNRTLVKYEQKQTKFELQSIKYQK